MTLVQSVDRVRRARLGRDDRDDSRMERRAGQDSPNHVAENIHCDFGHTGPLDNGAGHDSRETSCLLQLWTFRVQCSKAVVWDAQ